MRILLFGCFAVLAVFGQKASHRVTAEGSEIETTAQRGFTIFSDHSSPFHLDYVAAYKAEGKTFWSLQQFHSYKKAVTFGEMGIARQILNTKDPAEARRLGNQKMRRFRPRVWEHMAVGVMKRAIGAKFRQKRELRELLRSAKATTIVYATRADLKWGTGVDKNDPKIRHPEQWPGENQLGKALNAIGRTL